MSYALCDIKRTTYSTEGDAVAIIFPAANVTAIVDSID